jgi:hypothetical protein
VEGKSRVKNTPENSKKKLCILHILSKSVPTRKKLSTEMDVLR